MKRIAILTLILLALPCVAHCQGTISGHGTITISSAPPPPSMGPLTVSTTNPRYFINPSGQAVLLAGSHTWAVHQDQGTPAPQTFDYNGWISFMVSHGMNFFRYYVWFFPNGGFTHESAIQFTGPMFQWQRTGPGTANDGGLKYDLTKLDQTYFDRMRARVIQAGASGIYTAIMLWNGYEWQFDINGSDGNPFESANNINGVNCPTTCPTDNSLITAQVQTIENAYMLKVIQTVNDQPNVLYEVANEAGSSYSDTWQASVINFVRTTEAGMPSQHPIGMTFQFSGGTDQKLYNSAADWVSPAFGGGGLNVPPDATGQCPTVTGNGGAANPSSSRCKAVINDTDHDCGVCGSGASGQTWVWQNFTRGNGALFEDEYLIHIPDNSTFPGFITNLCTGTVTNNICQGSVDPQWNPARSAMGDIITYSKKIDLLHMPPHDSLSTSGFCLANPGQQYLVYSTTNNFTLTTVAGTYTFEWFNPTTHAIASTGSVTVGTSQAFTAPFSGDSVLWLHH